MIDTLISFMAPHHCSLCGINGTSLCDYCINNIDMTMENTCLQCGSQLFRYECIACNSPIEKTIICAQYTDEVMQVIKRYKFEGVRDLSNKIISIACRTAPILPIDCVIASVPTTHKHIRQRGYDHAKQLARHLGKRYNVSVQEKLTRTRQFVQVGSSRRERIQQADGAFAVKGKLAPEKTYVIVDDVVTTGATALSCAKTLHEAGARHIWLWAIARSTLDQR